MIGRCNRDHIVVVGRERCWPDRAGLDVDIAVAGGGDNDDTLGLSELDRHLDGIERRAGQARLGAEADIDDVGSVAHGVTDACGDTAGVAAAVVAKHADVHDRRARGHTGDANIVDPGAGDPSHMGAVEVVRSVKEQRVVVDEVPAITVVDIAVGVVVDAVATDFARVGPSRLGEVRVAEVDAGVEHCDDHTLASRRGGPGVGDIDVGIGDRTRTRPVVLQAPLLAEIGVGFKGRDGFIDDDVQVANDVSEFVFGIRRHHRDGGVVDHRDALDHGVGLERQRQVGNIGEGAGGNLRRRLGGGCRRGRFDGRGRCLGANDGGRAGSGRQCNLGTIVIERPVVTSIVDHDGRGAVARVEQRQVESRRVEPSEVGSSVVESSVVGSGLISPSRRCRGDWRSRCRGDWRSRCRGDWRSRRSGG